MTRRADKENFRWALHGYAGVGVQFYKTELTDQNLYQSKPLTYEKDMTLSSLLVHTGLGLKYKVSKSIDLELRGMYTFTGDDGFDGGGVDENVAPGYNKIKNTNSDNLFTATLGVSFKLGKQPEHLAWYNPNKEKKDRKEFKACKKGDNDQDGVCDDWDKELDTPLGARVDGSGVALDTDLDGVIDLYDECVTVPGPKENKGCPYDSEKSFEMNIVFDDIGFEFDSSELTSAAKSDLKIWASKIAKTNESYRVVGTTDANGSIEYNQKLSERRANAVKTYLISVGVSADRLEAIGRGIRGMRYPECQPASDCPPWKNYANRRVYIQQK